MREAIKATANAPHVLVWRAVSALCVLTMIIFAVLAAQHYLVPSGSSAVGRSAGQDELPLTDESPAAASVEVGGVSAACSSCDARHRHILRLREANP